MMTDSRNQKNLEIERKYLIVYPSEEELAALPGARCADITQTYLLSESGERRVRRWEEDGWVRYIFTRKEKKSGITRFEAEEEITEERYHALLAEADPTLFPLHKRRYTIPYSGGVGEYRAEIDLYPFFTDRAILEVELSSEDEVFPLPEFVTVIREVTGEREYKNPVLARRGGASADQSSLGQGENMSGVLP